MGRTIDVAVRVRAIAPSDADNYRGILQRTTPEDRLCRFFHLVDHFDDAAIASYVEPRPDVIGFIAERAGQPAGVGHAFFVDASQAEIALVVADDARRHGVGRLLFECLIAALQRHGCSSVIAHALSENNAFRHLAQSAGMRPRADGPVTTWTLSVAPHLGQIQ